MEKKKEIQLPFQPETLQDIRVGDFLSLTGILYTGRDALHQYLFEGNPCPVSLKDGIIYHCGPIMVQEEGRWAVKGAGPTTSAREEPYQAQVIEQEGLRGVIGKGGMGAQTKEACEKFGCLYLHAIGGAAQLLANCVTHVEDVYFYEEFGSPEALWILRVQDFPVLVTIDAHGESLHEEIQRESEKKFKKLLYL